MRKLYIFILGLVGYFLLLGSVPVLAQQNQGGNTTSGSSSSSGQSAQGVESDQAQGASGQSQSDNNGKGLSSDRKAECEKRQSSIDGTMNKYSVTMQNRNMYLNKVIERVKQYYESNNLESKDYEQIMARITTRQVLIERITNQVKQGASINCGATDPLGEAQQFRTHVQTAQHEMQQLRTDINSLIDAVIAIVEKEA